MWMEKSRDRETDRERVKCVQSSIIIDLSDRYLAKQRERPERGRAGRVKCTQSSLISRVVLAHQRDRNGELNAKSSVFSHYLHTH